MEDISKLKLEIIKYYDQIKHAIDIRSQQILMDQNTGNEIKEKVLNRAEELSEKCNEIFNLNISKLNDTQVKNLPADLDTLRMELVAFDCFFIENSVLKFDSPLGGLIVTDWCLSENEKKFIERVFIGNKIPFDKSEQEDDLVLNLTEKLILLKCTFDKNIDAAKQNHLRDIIVINTDLVKKEVNEITLFKLSEYRIECFDLDFSSNFKKLTRLDLSFNKIKKIRSNLFKNNLESLKTLFLFSCDLTEIEENAFVGLNSLEELDLAENKNLHLNCDQFNGLENLKKLNLSDNTFSVDINELQIFKNLTKLVELDLALNDLRNRITDSMFTGLSNLEKLDLSHCMITNIQLNSFAHLTKLKTLNLGYNHLYELTPDHFPILKNLNELQLQECSIQEIDPDTFAELNELKILGIASNNIRNLNKRALKGLENLTDLTLDYRPDLSINLFEDLRSLEILEFEYKSELWPIRSEYDVSRAFNLNPNVVIQFQEV